MLVLGVDAEDVVYGQQGAVVESPANECPVGTMPKAADAPYNINVAYDFPFVTAAASQGEVDVVAEPSCQGNVPTAPKFGDAS